MTKKHAIQLAQELAERRIGNTYLVVRIVRRGRPRFHVVRSDDGHEEDYAADLLAVNLCAESAEAVTGFRSEAHLILKPRES